MIKHFIGIDTSCYTTSIAVVDSEGNLVGDYREPLPVEKGKIGLRQSNGFFMHVGHLPTLYEKVVCDIDPQSIVAVGVSSQPRYIEDSYMPVFTAGHHFAKTISLSLNTELYTFSHQEGHIEAANWSAVFSDDRFLAVHLSGGTSEILVVKTNRNRFKAEIVGGAEDISAGKLIDRVGVYMGTDFPAGKILDDSITFDKKRKRGYPTSVKGGKINFSGLENYATKKFDEGSSLNEVAEGLFESVSKSILKAVTYVAHEQNLKTVLFAGGVSSSQYLKAYIKAHNKSQLKFIFSDAKYAVDNAVGIAQMTRKSFQIK